MITGKSYVYILAFFGVFLVVSTLQLGKSRTTLDMLQKRKVSASVQPQQMYPLPHNAQNTRPVDDPLSLNPGLSVLTEVTDTLLVPVVD